MNFNSLISRFKKMKWCSKFHKTILYVVSLKYFSLVTLEINILWRIIMFTFYQPHKHAKIVVWLKMSIYMLKILNRKSYRKVLKSVFQWRTIQMWKTLIQVKYAGNRFQANRLRDIIKGLILETNLTCVTLTTINH